MLIDPLRLWPLPVTDPSLKNREAYWTLASMIHGDAVI